MADNIHNYIWDHDEAKKIFQKSIWPTFVGSKSFKGSKKSKYYTNKKESDDSEKSAILPIILWNEQFGVLNKSPSKQDKDVHYISDGSTFDNETKKMRLSNDSIIHHSDYTEYDISTNAHDKWMSDQSSSSLFQPVVYNSNPIILRKKESNMTLINSNISEVSVTQQKIFTDLYQYGYFIGPGHMYGGDYCLYKDGDPSLSHSIATLRIIHSPDTIRSTYSSLKSHNLKKQPLLLSNSIVSDKNNEIITSSSPPPLSDISLLTTTSNTIATTTATADILSQSLLNNNNNNNNNSNTSSSSSTNNNSIKMSAKDFLSYCRLQNHVAKNAILAFISPTSSSLLLSSSSSSTVSIPVITTTTTTTTTNANNDNSDKYNEDNQNTTTTTSSSSSFSILTSYDHIYESTVNDNSTIKNISTSISSEKIQEFKICYLVSNFIYVNERNI